MSEPIHALPIPLAAALLFAACGGAPTAPRPAAPAVASALAAATSVASSPVAAPPAPAAAPPEELWPAGTCGFDPYLGGACGDRGAPRFAVVLGEFARGQFPSRRFKRLTGLEGAEGRAPAGASRALLADLPLRPEDELARAEAALARAKKLGLPAGYPLLLTWDDLPARDEKRRGLALVAGLFGARAPAERWAAARGLSAEIVELAGPDAAQPICDGDYAACMASRVSAVEVFVTTKAWDEKAVEALDAEQDQLPWIRLDLATERYHKALEALPAACEIEAGRVFLAPNDALYGFMRKLAPVRCKDGKRAWVPWRATRLESAVIPGERGPELFQVVLVECDVPTLEARPFLPEIPATLLAQGAGCPG